MIKPKGFGVSYLLDLYDCTPGACDDLELNYRYLERAVDVLGMTKMSQPIVIHGPTDKGKELYPDKAGVSGWVPLIESGIQIHTLEPKRFVTIDIYTCGCFEREKILQFTLDTFDPKHYNEQLIERGTKY